MHLLDLGECSPEVDVVVHSPSGLQFSVTKVNETMEIGGGERLRGRVGDTFVLTYVYGGRSRRPFYLLYYPTLGRRLSHKSFYKSNYYPVDTPRPPLPFILLRDERQVKRKYGL